MKLQDHHLKKLVKESGIAQKVAEERGYWTEVTKVGLKRRGFADKQCNPPALCIPLYGPTGDLVGYQIRPDAPRKERGKLIKYELPAGDRMVLDVHPSMREKLADPRKPLMITEGICKGDSLVTRGLCTMTILGVWNWRGTNELGGKVALPEWELVGLNSRRVYLAFDSDVMLKPEVHRALARLKGFLESREAEVAVIYLPHGEGGAKQGVDDYLVAGHGVDDLLSLATTELRELPEGEDLADEPDTQAAKLVNYAAEADLFHTPDGEAYASLPVEED